MIVVHYPTAFKALDRFIDAFNEKALNATDRLRTGAVMTAKELIRIYGISLLKINGLQELTGKELPSLQTNNHQLAHLVKCSARTIQRNLHKLLSAGIITHKHFRGSNANYELWINPQILLINPAPGVDKQQKQTKDAFVAKNSVSLKSRLSEQQTSNCPHTYSCNTSNKLNNIIIAVDNSVETIRNSLPLRDQSLTSYDTSDNAGNSNRNTGEIARQDFENQKFHQNIKKQDTGEIASRADTSGRLNAEQDTARDNSLTLYTSLFWLTARNLLYKQKDLTEHQVLIAKKLIRQLYDPVPTHRLSQVHSHYIARIALVSNYIQRNPEKRYVQLPYRYFDTTNAAGFVGTKKWYLAQVRRRRETERELVVTRAIRKYQQNESKDSLHRKPQLQLFRECENTVGKLNDPVLMQRFHAAVLHHETYRLLSTN